MSIPQSPAAESLAASIDKLVQEQTFTQGALEGIIALKKWAADLEFALKGKEALVDSMTRRTSELSEQVEGLRADKLALTTRLGAIEERERKMLELELTAKFEAEKRGIAIEMFNTVFRPSSVRELVHGAIPVVLPGTPGDMSRGIYPTPAMVQTGTQSLTRTTTEE